MLRFFCVNYSLCGYQRPNYLGAKKLRRKLSDDGSKLENMTELTTQMEDMPASGSTSRLALSCTLASQALSKHRQSKPSKSCCKKPTQADSCIATLDLDSISSDVALEPYWNARCAANHSTWWLPHQTVSQDPAFRSSVTSSNYQAEQSIFWKETIRPINSTFERSLPLSLPTATPSTASAVIKGAKKVRVYPKNEDVLLEFVRQQRRAYNLAIACFKEADERPELRKSDALKAVALRATIREFVRDEAKERDGAFLSSGCDEAVNAAYATRDGVIRKRKSGEAAGYTFRSRKDVRQSFLFQKLSAGFVSKHFDVSERLPGEAYKKITNIVFERGRWFICAQMHITTAECAETQGLKVVAIDPGVRAFATAYSDDQCITYASTFYQDKVFPLLLHIDKLIGLRARARNDQWKRHYNKRIDRKINRAKDLVYDLHKRVAFDLVQKFDVLLLPSFETREMVAKSDRKIKNKTVRSMLGLAHYRFKRHLAWMCKKYGKRLVICNEAYTSKTRSWDGSVKAGLGGAKTISDGAIIVDRDVNGARGILLRALYGNLGRDQATNTA